jgi:hypothetical protein
MQALKTVIDSSKLETLISLPQSFQNRKVAITIQVITDGKKKINRDKDLFPESESFGMWKDRTDMDDVEKYVRDMRKGRQF